MTLDDDILAALPGLFTDHPQGVSADVIAAAVACTAQQARDAAKRLHAGGLALNARWPGSKARFLLPLDGLARGLRCCAWCGLVFELPRKSKRRCCTRACSIAWSWSNPETKANRMAPMIAAKRTPEARARQSEENNRRWADPARREKMARQSRERWADPAMRAKMSAAIQAVNGSAKERARHSELRKALWADPTYREKASAAMRAAKQRPEARQRFSEALKRRWADPEQRAKLAAACAQNVRGKQIKKQSPEQIAKRIASTKATKASRKSQEQS
jgi:hypothetical protein